MTAPSSPDTTSLASAVERGKERPIIFSAPMVRAILAGRKTQTRRVLREQPPTPEQFRGSTFSLDRAVADGVMLYSQNDYERLPKHPTDWELLGSVGVARTAGFPTRFTVPFSAGDRLWVKENWRTTGDAGRADSTAPSKIQPHRVWYEADGQAPADEAAGKLRPSIFTPRWASRLTLLVADVRVERLNAISHADAIAEGVEHESANPPFYYVPGIHPHSLTAVGVEQPGGRHAERSFAKLWEHINGAGSWGANPWVVAVSFQPFQTNIDRMPERQAPVVPAAAE